MPDFPRLNDTNFPHIENVNVYKYENDFDYARYDAMQMQLQVCTVPWDMGEAHVGQRTISGIGNVVYFGSTEKRDAWFDAIPDNECYRFETKYKELHRDHVIDVPIPYDMCARHNYLVVKYNLLANDDSLVAYEGENGVREWFWFIREVEFVAPNTTRLHLLEDAWQTWIYDVQIPSMILERGHAPMFKTSVSKYLANPIENAVNLLTEDVNFGDTFISKHESEFVFNTGDMYAIIITTANINGTWGTKAGGDWKTPGNWNVQMQGVPSYYAFAVAVGNLSTFLTNVNSTYPQFVQTVKAIAFVSDSLISRSNTPVTFASVSCYTLTANYVENDLVTIDKDDFGYDAKYANIAKLYTYPYAYILVTDESGTQTEVRIENTNGKISIQSQINLVFPWLTINAHLTGIGKGSKRNISFKNITTRNMPIQGNWYDYLMSWNIPTFGIYQDAEKTNDYDTHFDRAQAAYAATNENTSAIASATTAQSNANEAASCLVDNADLTADTNDAITARSNSSATTESGITQSFNSYMVGVDNTITSMSASSTIQAADQQAALAATMGGISAGVSAIGSAASGNYAGAVVGAVNGVIGASTTIASTAIGNSLTAAYASNTIIGNQQHATAANTKTSDQTTNQTDTATDITDYQNDLTTGSAANTAAMEIANATRTYNTDTANANRQYDTATNAIANQIAQAALNAPNEFGAWNYGDLSTSRPMGLFANIVTQTDAAISAAGDEMLRYGYMYNKQWLFDGNWNIGKHFTYWKLSDFWVRGLNVPDMYMDRLRFFLFGGVTVWRKPEDIGNVTIYDNVNIYDNL